MEASIKNVTKSYGELWVDFGKERRVAVTTSYVLWRYVAISSAIGVRGDSMRWLTPFAFAFVLTGCGDDAPKHYYVLCEERDGAGWRLIDHRRDSKGYILACTYQSPDRQQSYTVRCGESGCD